MSVFLPGPAASRALRRDRVRRVAPAVCLLALLLLPSAVSASRRHAAPPTVAHSARHAVAEEEWTGVYFGRKKIGYSVTRTTPTTFLSAPALKESGHTVTRLLLLGANVEEDEVSESITDLNHRPLRQTLDVKSNGSALHVEARFDYAAGKVYCVLGSGPAATHKTLDIPPGANLATDTNTLTQGHALSVGKSYKFYYLQPLSVELRPATLEVTGKATIRSDSGSQVATFEVHADMPEGKMIGWAAADGTLVKSELSIGAFGMTMVHESRHHALDTAYASPALAPAVAGAAVAPADFADATALKPDRILPDPRKMRYLKVKISGVPEQNMVASDARQSFTRDGEGANGITADFTVTAEKFAAADADTWPVRDPALTPFLSRAAYLETDDALIRQTALRLRGKETNLYRIASNIRDWVHEVMTPDPSIAVVRSAKDVFGRRRGVCRDYATLYTAVARAAGVPTRLCAGIVYAEGKFFYHAWAESFVGKWVAFDPTLYDAKQASYVDATHIKFAQGDVTQMFEVVSIVGRLKVHVVASDPAPLDPAGAGAANAAN
jgi:transglutaminase-like putative cysteine protease